MNELIVEISNKYQEVDEYEERLGDTFCWIRYDNEVWNHWLNIGNQLKSFYKDDELSEKAFIEALDSWRDSYEKKLVKFESLETLLLSIMKLNY